MEVGFGPGDIVLDETPPPKKRGGAQGTAPPILAHVYCGQTVGWIKMKLGMEVGLGPDHIVIDGDPAHSPKRGTDPNIRPMSVVVKQLDGLRCHLVRR